MTTKVTVDAHAGWPVKVEALDKWEDDTGIHASRTTLATVEPGTVQDFHATDTRQILVTELKAPAHG